jgi:hypothetical protein
MSEREVVEQPILAPAASACCSSSRLSTSNLDELAAVGRRCATCCAAAIAGAMPPAAWMWFSLDQDRVPQRQPVVAAAAARTAYFCATRRPGSVFAYRRPAPWCRRSRRHRCAPCWRRPDSSCRKFSALRSAVSSARPLPVISQSSWLAAMRLAVGGLPGDRRARIETGDAFVEPRGAAQHAGFAADHRRALT